MKVSKRFENSPICSTKILLPWCPTPTFPFPTYGRAPDSFRALGHFSMTRHVKVAAEPLLLCLIVPVWGWGKGKG
jgi:hypothetical protein